ncbi:MAG: hypothetical protein AAF404_13735, partial [Pseudomonadota bacterium]
MNREFTILYETCITLFLVALIATPASAQTTRSATLQEPGGTSQHTYDAATESSKTRIDLASETRRTVQHHSPLFWLFDVSISLQHDYD